MGFLNWNWFINDKVAPKKVVTGFSPASNPVANNVPLRTNFLIGFIGTNRTGKSSIARMVADEWRNSRYKSDMEKFGKKKHVIVSFDPQGRFKDISDYLIRPDDKKWARRLLTLRNALVILDDYRLINPQNTAVDGLTDLLYFRAENNIDIMYICHNPMLVINALTYFTNQYYIFYTQATEGKFSAKMNNATVCINASMKVNDYVNKYGRGAHPLSDEYKAMKIKQTFPYAVVSQESTTPQLFNMEQDPTLKNQ